MRTSAALDSTQTPIFRRPASGTEPTILADIYEEEVDIAIWQRQPSQRLSRIVDRLLNAKPDLQLVLNAPPRELPDLLLEQLVLGGEDNGKLSYLVQDIANIANMFSCLFELHRVGLRLSVLDKAMCPRFHVDRVPARLVTTYLGAGTEWLSNTVVDRRMLGTGSMGVPDHESGLYLLDDDIQKLGANDVALLKGEAWEGNENAGLVHRSPAVNDGERRLLLTLDFVS